MNTHGSIGITMHFIGDQDYVKVFTVLPFTDQGGLKPGIILAPGYTGNLTKRAGKGGTFMKKDEYSFLELFGNIDDKYIYQTLQPWKGQTGRHIVYHIVKKVACLAVIAMIGFGLIFHEQVSAAVSKFTSMIAEILQISNNLDPYTDVINTTQKKNGISITLKEAILTGNSLLISVNLDVENEYDGVGISAGENIKINGSEYTCDSSTVYQKQNLEENDNRYVVEWIYDDGVPLPKKADIEIEIVVHKQIDDIEGEAFTFAFSTSKEELQKNTVHLKLAQKIGLDNGEAIIREFSINSVTSNLKLECDKLSPEKKQYYIEIRDMQGNKALYSQIKNEGNLFTFQNNGNTLSSNSKWLDGQIYALPYDIENRDAVDFGTMEGEISEVFTVDSTEMQPIGQIFRIILKE